MINIYNPNNHNEMPEKNPAADNSKKADFRSYVDPTGEFGSKELGRGIWFVQHRVFLYKLLVGILIGISALLWLVSLWKWTDFLLIGWNKDVQLQNSLARFNDYTVIHAHYSARPISIVSTQILPGGVDKYDAVSEVVNSNEHFYAQFNYYFVIGGAKTPAQKTFLLPGEDRMLAALGLASSVYQGEATLVLDNVTWTRISPHLVVVPKEWQADRLNFAVSNFNFSSAATKESPNASAITFEFTNNSAYNYVVANFYVALYSQGSLTGILPLGLQIFNSLETKKIDLRDFVPNLTVDSAQVFPIIDLYNPAVYLPPVAK